MYIRDVQTARDVEVGEVVAHSTQVLDAEVSQLQGIGTNIQDDRHSVSCFTVHPFNMCY